MNAVATAELRVSADGSLQTLDKFERGMENAARATDGATGSLDRYNAIVAKGNAAREKQLAITTESYARRSKEQALAERVISRTNKLVGLEIKLRREAERAAVDLGNAVNLGYIKPQTAVAELTRMEAQHAAQMEAATADAHRLSGAQDALATSTKRASVAVAAANDNIASSRMRMMNMAYQINDIGTMLAMGASPFMIMASQGGQVAQILGDHPGGVVGGLKETGSATASLARRFGPLAVAIGVLAIGMRAVQTEINETSDVAVSFGDTFAATMRVSARAVAQSFIPEIEAAKEALDGLWEGFESFVSESMRRDLRTLAEVGAQINLVTEILNGQEGAWERYQARRKEIFSEGWGERLIADEAQRIASEKLTEVYADQTKTLEENVESIRRQVGMFGQSESAIAAAEFRIEAMADALEVANKAGQDSVPPEQIERINRLAEEYGIATEKLEKLRDAAKQAKREQDLLADLAFDRSLLGMPDIEQEIRRTLRENEIAFDSYTGQRVAGEMRYIDAVERANEKMIDSRDIAEEFGETLLDALYDGENALDGLIDMFAKLGRQFAQMGLEKLLSGFQGGSGGLSVNVSAPSSTPFFTGHPVGHVERRSLPPITMERGPLVALSDQAGQEISTSIMDSYAAAIRKIESGSYAGNYGALGPVTRSGDRAYGAYQVMGNNIASWTQEVLGTSMSIKDFLGDRAAQDEVFYAKFGQSIDKFGNVSDAVSVWFSGRPMNQAGNASDGYNTVPQYVSKFDKALAGVNGETTLLPRVMTRAMAEGVSDGLFDAQQRASMGPNFDTSAPAGGGFFQRGGGQVLGAAAGAFFGGMQSGSPLMGGISGALTGLGAAGSIGTAFHALAGMAGPVGLIGGAVLGIVGGIIGNAQKEEQEREAAEDQLEAQLGAIQSFINSAEGVYPGEYMKRFREVTDEMSKIRELAEKAGKGDLVDRIDAAMATFFDFLVEDWERGVEGVIAAMNAGHGFEGAFVQARSAILDMQEALVGFVEDAKFFAGSGGDLETALQMQKDALNWQEGLQWTSVLTHAPKSPDISQGYRDAVNRWASAITDLELQVYDQGRNDNYMSVPASQIFNSVTDLKMKLEELGVTFDETGEIIKEVDEEQARSLAEQVARAQEAAQNMALAQLSGAEEFSAMETEIQRIEGTAAGLQTTLEKLGMTAEEAAAAIDEHLAIALENLRDDLMTDINRSIATLTDSGYINELMDAQAAYEARLDDFRAIGMDASLATQELNLRLRQIAVDAGLTDEQLRQLAGAFPLISGGLLGLIGLGGGGTADAAQAVADAEAAVSKAEQDLRDAYREQASVIEGNIRQLEQFVEGLEEFKKSLRLDPQLSPLSPFERLIEAQKQFQEISAAAKDGDQEAIGELEDVSRQYLEEARAYYGSSEAYFSIFEQVESILDSALDAAKGQLSEAEKQLAALNEQIGYLIDIDNSVMSVADAISALATAQAGLNSAIAAKDAADAAYQDQIADLIDRIGQQNGAAVDASPEVLKIYRDIVGRLPDQEGADYWQKRFDSGMSVDAIYKQFIRDVITLGATPNADFAKKYGFTGYYADGGFHTGGLRVVGERGPELEATGPSRIWSAQQTRQMLSGSNDNGELVAEVRALRGEVTSLKAVIAAGERANVEATREGTAETRNLNRQLQHEQTRRPPGRRAS